jgi:hypothetical protein
MSQPSIASWLRFVFGPIGRALGAIVRPWTDLRAVKANQIDIINAVGDQQADIAGVIASMNEMSRELARLGARTAELEAKVRQILASAEFKQRADG